VENVFHAMEKTKFIEAQIQKISLYFFFEKKYELLKLNEL